MLACEVFLARIGVSFYRTAAQGSTPRITSIRPLYEFGGDDLVGVLFRQVKSEAADGEIDDFMSISRSRPG